MLLDRVVLKELRRTKSRTVMLVVALGVAFLMPAGIEMGLRSLLATRDAFTSQLRLADLEIRMLPEDVRHLPNWKEIPGVEQAEARLMMPGTIKDARGRTANALLVYLGPGEPQINRLQIREGRLLADGPLEEAVVERSAKQYQGFSLGDQMAIQVGRQTYRQKIVGVAASPEFFIVAANPEYFLPEKGSLAVVYTRLARVHDNLGFSMANDLVFRYRPGADPASVKRAILGALGSRKIERVIAKEEHLSWKHVAIDHDVFRIFQPAIGLVLALLAAALVVVNFDRLVRRQYKELGALKAMGYSGWEVARSYLLAALVLALMGCLVGVAGAIAFRSAFLKIYAQAHGLAHLEHHVYLAVLLRSGLTTVLIALVSAVVATWRVRRSSPLALMRPLMHGSQRPQRARTWRLLDRLPLAARLGIKNLLRTPRLTAATVSGVALTVAVGVAYLVCLDSMKQAMVDSFQTQLWNRAVSFLYPALDEEYKALAAKVPGAQVEGFIRAQGLLSKGDAALDVSILGLRTEGSLRNLRLVAGRMASSDREIVIGTDLARKLTAAVGSELELSIRNERHRVTVVGVKRDVLLSEAVMSLATLQKLMELEDQATGMFLSVAPELDNAALDEKLRGSEFVGRVTSRDKLLTEFMTILQDIRKLVLLVALVALAVGIVFIVANVNMTMTERSSEFSTLWALGCDRRTASRIMSIDGLGQAALALLCAVPLTLGLASVLNRLASRAWFDQTTHVSPLLAAVAVVAVLGLTMLGTLPAFSRFWRSDLLENLRARSIQ